MKKLLKYTAVVVLGAMLWSCGDNELDPTSIFEGGTRPQTDFDRYLIREFTTPYNIAVKYRMEDILIDHTYSVVPARIESSQALAVFMKHLWLDVYAEASPDGVEFLKKFGIREIHFVGSGQHTANGVVLGSAEGGKLITMTHVNAIDPNDPETFAPAELLRHYGKFQVIHHEFCHILHQLKEYPTTFPQVSGGFQGTNWVNLNYNSAHDLGFVSPYATFGEFEDFVETYSLYITKTAPQWEEFLADASTQGRAYIDQKVTIVRDYIKLSWGMDLDQLRAIVIRRGNELPLLKVSDLK